MRVPLAAPWPPSSITHVGTEGGSHTVARRKRAKTERPIESYRHADKERLNNPPVGLVTPNTDPDAGPRHLRLRPPPGPKTAMGGQGRAHLL